MTFNFSSIANCIRKPWASLALIAAWLLSSLAAAAPPTTPAAGLRENTPAIHALVGARIVVAPGRVIEKGTIVLRNGTIVAVGADVPPPADARVWKLEGKTIYPGFIDAYQEIDVPAAADHPGGGYWNHNIVAHARAGESYKPDLGLNKKLRGQGIAARLVAPSGGIIKGTSALVCTGDEQGPETVLRSPVAMHLRLQPPPGGSRDGYPNSPMGAMALVRQSLLDAGWYRQAWQAYDSNASQTRPQRSLALEALQTAAEGGLPLVIDTPNELYFLRADGLGREFDRTVIVRGSGREYRRLDAIKAASRTIILPLQFPDPPQVDSPEFARAVPLEDLMHWDIAPENPGRLEAAGLKLVFTTEGLKDRDHFLEAIRTAIARGLTAEGALRALTTNAAELYQVADRLGTLDVGKHGNLVVTDGDLFAKGTKVLETWVDGNRYENAAAPLFDLRGSWDVTLQLPDGQPQTAVLKLEGDAAHPGGKLTVGDKQAGLSSAALEDSRFRVTLKGEPLGWPGVVRLSVAVTGDAGGETLVGGVTWADGRETNLSAARSVPPATAEETPAEKPEEKPGEPDKPDEASSKTPAETAAVPPPRRAWFPVVYPLSSQGLAAPPAQPGAVLFKNATVWTSGPQGTIENCSVLVEAGQIKAVGPGLTAPAGAVEIDCSGKHLTAGVIDCHSHIATDGGINESGQTITAEVRIADFINPNDPNIYRQLAGGVTAVNVLHGSANTIGGQNQVIKLRWGSLPEEMKFAAAPPGIKFALGENVKQSNGGGDGSRYPQSRMGVEQLVLDAFRAAQAYQRTWDKWRASQQGPPPRTDLELEALVEVLQGKRLIHCHSYRQDEILAFLRTCRGFGVRVATLQHVLEGYKLADVMAESGVGGSTFSDWWAYKFEVYDAIPYNAALMHGAGVVVSLNSDFPELARRLNLEAAKAVKYGGVEPVEALKMVTFNPARQLGVDAKVGSIEPGKDADLALWSHSPLSTYTRCEQTWIDGRKYFDLQSDLAQRPQAESKRAALVQRILNPEAAAPSLDPNKSAAPPAL
ncbi:MAG: amidohydrolase family protein [Pirellulales bacterium]